MPAMGRPIRKEPLANSDGGFLQGPIAEAAPWLGSVLTTHPGIDEFFLDQLNAETHKERLVVLNELFGSSVDGDEDLVDQWEALCARCSNRTKYHRVQSIQGLRSPSRRRTVPFVDQAMNHDVPLAVEPGFYQLDVILVGGRRGELRNNRCFRSSRARGTAACKLGL